MAYATITDVFVRYKPIRTMVGSSDLMVTSEDVSSIFIADAENYINGFLALRYEVPVPDSALVRQCAADLAIFNMLVEKLPDIPDFIQGRYDRWHKTLEMLRDGEMVLTSATVIESGDQEAWSSTEDYHPIFSPVLDPVDQRVDIDWVESEKAARENDV